MSEDPFEHKDYPKSETVSWAKVPVGGIVHGILEGPARQLQSRDFKTKLPATWPDGNPKYSAVVNLTVDGKSMAIWAEKPSALFRALAEALDGAGGAKFAKGGELWVKRLPDVPSKGGGNPAHQFTAKYVPPKVTDEPPF